MIRVAVIDSGVNAAHPHISGVAGGTPDDYVDILGHGTAVMAAIQEKAPTAEYYAVRVFTKALRTTAEQLVRAIEWSIDHGVNVVNLSLGTINQKHRGLFEPVVARARDAGIILVSAHDVEGTPALPGSLDGVIAAGLDWDCPRESYRLRREGEDAEFYASGYPRSLPGVPPSRNLYGISFAVANMTGFVIRACEEVGSSNFDLVHAALRQGALT